MTEIRANAHLTDNDISDVLDERVPSEHVEVLRAHLSTCSSCAARLAQAQTVADLLHGLPDVPLPRDFRLTEVSVGRPVAVLDPPNLVRLRGWYTAARVVSGSLAAAFIALVAATLYVDSRPVPLLSSSSLSSSQSGAPPAVAPQIATPARDAAASSSAGRASAPAPAAAPAVSRAAPRPVAGDGDPTDQQAATTTVGPLPTPVPTLAPLPTRSAVAAGPVALPPASPSDTPWRLAAGTCAVLAVLALVSALMLRRRIEHSHIPLSE